MFRHDAQRTGSTSSLAPSTNVTKWIYNSTSGSFYGSPAVANNTLVVSSSIGDVIAINTTTGTLIWTYRTYAVDNSIISGSPAIDSGRVYVTVEDNNLYCLNQTTGALLWNYVTAGPVTSSPLINESSVYFSSSSDKFYCLNSTTGEYIWSNDEVVGSTLAISGNTLFVGNSSNLVALDASTGIVQWTTISASPSSTPAISDGKLYFGAYNGLYCLDASNGNIIWHYAEISVYRSSPAVADGLIFIADNNGKLYCNDALTGALIWTANTQGLLMSANSPIIADGKVYIGEDIHGRNIYCFTQTTGELIWSYLVLSRCISGPVICDGVVYAGTEDAKIYAFGPPIDYMPLNLELSLNSDTSFLGFKTVLNGQLTSNGNSVSGVPIEFSYSINNGVTWNDITSTTSDTNGNYSVVWVPSATGTYLVKAMIRDNYPYPQTQTIKTLSVTLYDDEYVFSVESNSTVTALAFNSTSNSISFSVSGDQGTTGYASITVPKSLVGDIVNLKVYVDNQAKQFAVTSVDDSWVISLAYPHSSHGITIDLGSLPQESTSPEPTETATSTPTETPLTTVTPTTSPTSSPTTNPTESPTIPELPSWIILLLPILLIAATIIIRNNQKSNQKK
jgi:outer membrane protein assembly factor BamB